MENPQNRRIVIPAGRSDESGSTQEAQQKPPFKPLLHVELPGTGVYEIGVPGDFASPTFSLKAVDEDGGEIPIITVKKTIRNGKTVYSPTEDHAAINLFSRFMKPGDLERVKDMFGLEVDGWIEQQSKKH